MSQFRRAIWTRQALNCSITILSLS